MNEPQQKTHRTTREGRTGRTERRLSRIELKKIENDDCGEGRSGNRQNEKRRDVLGILDMNDTGKYSAIRDTSVCSLAGRVESIVGRPSVNFVMIMHQNAINQILLHQFLNNALIFANVRNVLSVFESLFFLDAIVEDNTV